MSHNCVASTRHTISPGEQFRLTLRTTVSSNRQLFVFKVYVLRTKVSSNTQLFVFKVDVTHHGVRNAPRLTLRTTVPVRCGQELYTSYTHSLEPTLVRRENLSRGKYFDCSCTRCKDPTELGTHLGTLKCNKCDPGLILSTNPLDPEAQWKCSHCEFSTGGGAVRRVLSVIQAEMDAVEWMPLDEQSVEARERLWRKYRSVLHPRHAFITCIRLSLSQLYGRVPGYRLDEMPDILHERKIEICKDLMAVADVLEPGLTRLRGKCES
uniref:Protein msta n=1 Tax=Timema monikensis TaxID=170555 RepID=A0A7R9EKV6_9NEOP|nr:unnamed protein product [Timema monikensis]